MKVPRAAPKMITNSQGCQITARWPPSAANPPRMLPKLTTTPMMKFTVDSPSKPSSEGRRWSLRGPVGRTASLTKASGAKVGRTERRQPRIAHGHIHQLQRAGTHLARDPSAHREGSVGGARDRVLRKQDRLDQDDR